MSCRDSSCLSSSSHCENLGSIPDNSMSDFWWTVTFAQTSLRILSLTAGSIIPPILHTHSFIHSSIIDAVQSQQLTVSSNEASKRLSTSGTSLWRQCSVWSSGVPRGGVWGCSTPPPPKFRRPSKIVPNSTRLWKLLKIAEFRTPTPQDVQKKRQ